jgi:hypothetical protein
MAKVVKFASVQQQFSVSPCYSAKFLPAPNVSPANLVRMNRACCEIFCRAGSSAGDLIRAIANYFTLQGTSDSRKMIWATLGRNLLHQYW